MRACAAAPARRADGSPACAGQQFKGNDTGLFRENSGRRPVKHKSSLQKRRAQQKTKRTPYGARSSATHQKNLEIPSLLPLIPRSGSGGRPPQVGAAAHTCTDGAALTAHAEPSGSTSNAQFFPAREAESWGFGGDYLPRRGSGAAPLCLSCLSCFPAFPNSPPPPLRLLFALGRAHEGRGVFGAFGGEVGKP